MKKRFTGWLSLILALVLSCGVLFAGCEFFSCQEDLTGRTFTVTYHDYDGAHSFDVRQGFEYSITPPTRTGYEFLGLFDSETGGKQYVAANGSGIGLYEERQGILLYPRWKAKEYTINLNYGEAEGSSPQLTASYDSSLPELPKNVNLEHKVFKGWYTAAHCGGTMVADKNGLLPEVSVVNELNFNISNGLNRITLYAGFENEIYTVTLNFKGVAQDEVINAEYQTPVAELAYDTRNSGKAVYKWSTKSDLSDEFNGTIDKDITLYAKEWKNAISFDTDGGNKVAPVVAEEGNKVTLPEAQKDLYKFLYWENNGKKYTSTTMPAYNLTLKAVWQAKIVLDENGGEEVDDVSEAAGATITLPVPKRNGYIFAGWFDVYDAEYTSDKMPENPVKLKAGWYLALKIQKAVATDTSYSWDSKWNLRNELTLNLSDKLSENFEGRIQVTGSVKMKHRLASLSDPANSAIGFYKSKTISDSTKLYRKDCKVTSSSYETFDFSFSGILTGNVIYVAAASDGWGGNLLLGSSNRYTDFSNLVCEISYPDTSYMYL